MFAYKNLDIYEFRKALAELATLSRVPGRRFGMTVINMQVLIFKQVTIEIGEILDNNGFVMIEEIPHDTVH